MQTNIKILSGHVLDRIKDIPDNSIQCVVTSIPYFGLMSYGTEPQIWGGDKECSHEWIETNRKDMSGGQSDKQDSNREPRFESSSNSFCSKCGAWYGHLGLEPNIEMFADHVVNIFSEVKRVLHNSGVVYLNVGDSYSGSGGPGSQYDSKNPGYGKTFEKFDNPNRKIVNIPAKNLLLVPFRLAIALQEDGWIIRSIINWTKPNPMPESVTDRPSNDFEYIFMMVKSPKYFWDKENVRNNYKYDGRAKTSVEGKHCSIQHRSGERWPNSGANLKTTWTIPTEPLSCAVCSVCGKYWHRKPPNEHCGQAVIGHFAAYPTKLVENCLKSGASEKGCCPICFSPWERILKPSEEYAKLLGKDIINKKDHDKEDILNKGMSQKKTNPHVSAEYNTVGWQPTCKCVSTGTPDFIGDTDKHEVTMSYPEPIPCTVLDTFFGSGTTGLVAAKLGMNCIGIELNPNYVKMAVGRLKRELGLLCDVEVK